MLGARLLKKLVDYLRAHATHQLVGEVLESNTRMLKLARTFGFRIAEPASGVCALTLDLREPGPVAAGHET